MTTMTTDEPRLLNRAELLSARSLKRETVPVPEFGEGAAVMAQELSLNARMALWQYMERFSTDETRGVRWSAALTVLGVVDEAGETMLTMEDVDALGNQSSDAIQRIGAVVARLSGMNRTEAERPFDGTPNDASSSGSPSDSA